MITCSAMTDYDTKISVFSGSCAGLICVAGNDDLNSCGFNPFHSRVFLPVNSASTYYVLVHGFGSATGNFELSMTVTPPHPNDQPCGAIALNIPGNTPWDNRFAGVDRGEVSPGAGSSPGASCNSNDGWCNFETEVVSSVWYTFIAPPIGSRLSIGLDNILDMQFAIYQIEDCDNYSRFVEVGANDDSGPAFSPLIVVNDTAAFQCIVPGKTYYLQVDGFGSTIGSGNIVTTLINDPLGSCINYTNFIPTLSEWAVILLILLIVIVGSVYLQQRKSALVPERVRRE